MDNNYYKELNSLLKGIQSKGDQFKTLAGQSNNSLGAEFKNNFESVIPQKLHVLFPESEYTISASVGKGGFSKSPFIAILNKQETDTTREGVYLVFLFSKDLHKIYLSLAQGVTNTSKQNIVLTRERTRRVLNLENDFLTHLNNIEIENENYRKSAIYSRLWNCDDDDLCEKMLSEYKRAYESYMKRKDEIGIPSGDETDHAISGGTNATYPSVDGESGTPNASEDKNPPHFTPLQKIFFGTPGGGKSHKVKILIEEEHKAKDRMFRTTFHPDTDYASFVGSYKPVMKGNDIIYTYVPQVFTLAYVAAWNDPGHEYFLDIEEINRGNCAQIFGDLFQLLDRNEDGKSEYPVKADADLCDYLKNGKDKEGNDILRNKKGIEKDELCLPANLSIVATMNTSDQSLFPMDSAFKRRWDWEFVPSKFKPEHNYDIVIGTGAKQKTYKWHDFLKVVNGKIKEATDSEDKQMGSFFVKTNLDEEKFKSKVMFYLWSEICKDEYKTQNNFFRYKDAEKNDQEFTFNELYEDGSTEILQKFMSFLEVKPVNGSEETPADTEETSADTQDE